MKVINYIHKVICMVLLQCICMTIIVNIIVLIVNNTFLSADVLYIIFCINTILSATIAILVFVQKNRFLITIFNYIPRYIALELARRANNGELFNKNTTRDDKDSLTVFFYNISKIFDS